LERKKKIEVKIKEEELIKKRDGSKKNFPHFFFSYDFKIKRRKKRKKRKSKFSSSF